MLAGSDRMRLVCVGNGMTGVRTLEELIAIAPDLYDITVFGAEPHPNYNRMLLSPVLAGDETLQNIILNDYGWYERHGIALQAGKKIVRIDRPRRRVTAADGTTVEYDRLLLATGSCPVVLPVPGNDLPGVVTYRDIDDTHLMIQSAARYTRAVVIGGGLLGLEAANGLKARGMQVTVVHLARWLMERQLDETAAGLLQRSLERRGLAFVLGGETSAILAGPQGRVSAVRLADGTMLPADLVVMAAGIRPNTELAQKAGLHCSRGIVVNDTLQTFDPRIYAVGECVAHRGVAYGLVAPLFEMAKVCANHLAMRGSARYAGSVVSTKLKITGIDVFSAGDLGGGPDTEEVTLCDPLSGVYKKLVLKQDKLVGGMLYGDTADGPHYARLLRDGRCVRDIRDRLLFDAAHIADPVAGVRASAVRAG